MVRRCKELPTGSDGGKIRPLLEYCGRVGRINADRVLFLRRSIATWSLWNADEQEDSRYSLLSCVLEEANCDALVDDDEAGLGREISVGWGHGHGVVSFHVGLERELS